MRISQMMGIQDPLIASILDRSRRGAARRAPSAAMPPEQFQERQNKLLGMTMGGLQFVGNTLDKPGATVRGIIHGVTSGDPAEVAKSTLYAIPGTGIAGITKPEERVTGRQQLEDWGLAPENHEGFGGSEDDSFSPTDAAWDLAGFGYEVLTDPLTYTGIGVLNHAGRVLQKSGVLTKGAIERVARDAGRQTGRIRSLLDTNVHEFVKHSPDDVVKQIEETAIDNGYESLNQFLSKHSKEPLGNLIGFMGAQAGRGPTAKRVATGLDKVGETIGRSLPMRGLRTVFNKDVQGISDYDVAKRAEYLSNRKKRIQQIETSEMFDRIRKIEGVDLFDTERLTSTLTGGPLKDMGERIRYGEMLRNSRLKQGQPIVDPTLHGGVQDQVTQFARSKEDAMRAYVEHGANYQNEVGDLLGVQLPDLAPETKQMLDQLVEQQNEIHELAGSIGIDTSDYQGVYSEHFFRDALTPKGGHDGGFLGTPVLTARDSIMSRRREPIYDLPGQTSTVNQYIRDPRFSGKGRQIKSHNKAAEIITKELWGLSPVETGKETLDVGEAAIVGGRPFTPQWRDPESAQDFVTFNADTLKVDSLWAKDEGYIPPKGGGDEIAGRREQFLQWLQENPDEPIRTPDVTLVPDADGTHRLSFADGRHRFSVLRDKGQASVPITVPKHQAEAARKMLGYKSPELSKAKDFAKWLSYKSKEFAEKDARIFGKLPLEDHNTYMTRMRGLIETASEAERLFADHVAPLTDDMDDSKWVTLDKALKQVGLTKLDDEGELVAENVMRKLMPDGLDEVDSLSEVAVPRRLVREGTKMFGKFNSDKEISVLHKVWDSMTNLFKLGATAAPAFHSRNLASGQAQNWMIDAFNAESGGPRHIARAKRLLTTRGEVNGLVKDYPIFKRLGIETDKEATEWLRQEVTNYGLFDSRSAQFQGSPIGINLAPEHKLGLMQGSDRIAAMQPGNRPLTVKGMLKHANQGGWNPLKSAGIYDPSTGMIRNEDQFKPGRLHRDIGNLTEGVNRIAGFLGFLKQGIHPSEAAQRIQAAHVDYSHLTDVEKSVFKRLLPFYSFQKGMAQHVAQELAFKPGGKLAQTIRASNTLGRDGYLPDYVGEGAAIKIGKSVHPQTGEVTDRIISGLGLMHESPLSFLAYRKGPSPSKTITRSAARIADKFVGSMNPYAKLALEAASGEDFFTGRPLSELDPGAARAVTNVLDTIAPKDKPRQPYRDVGPFRAEHILANSPLSRPISTIRKAFDPRKEWWNKAVNTLTGVRITNRNMEREKALAARRLNREQMQMSPRLREFTTYYEPDWSKATESERKALKFAREAGKRIQKQRRVRIKKSTKSINKRAAAITNDLLRSIGLEPEDDEDK